MIWSCKLLPKYKLSVTCLHMLLFPIYNFSFTLTSVPLFITVYKGIDFFLNSLLEWQTSKKTKDIDLVKRQNAGFKINLKNIWAPEGK
jgi:hypothetical protein